MTMPDPAPGAAPLVETERLRLRAHRLDDFEALAAIWADPGVTRHIGGKPQGASESWARLLRYAGHWALLGYGFWAVEEKLSGRLAGEVGLADFRRDIEPAFESPELGWVLAPWAQGRGYATEAVRAARAWAHASFGPIDSVCMIDATNVASIRVAEKCGYRETARIAFKGEPVILFAAPFG